MKNSNQRILVMLIITIGILIGSGILAWYWIEPDSFLSAFGFLVLWGILSIIGHLILVGIVKVFKV